MDSTWFILILLVAVVGFFGYQWFMVASNKKDKERVKVRSQPSPQNPMLGEATPAPPAPEEYPRGAGQSETDLRRKEPTQRPELPVHQQPVTADGKAPAEFKENLRRPEQSFHDVSGPPPALKVSELPSGRAVDTNGQGFTPEMAQNDGPVMGDGVFAFDGMEPTGFANF